MRILDLLGLSSSHPRPSAANEPLTDEQRRQAARELTERCAYVSAGLALLPIPGADLLAIMPLHVALVSGIGQLYGVDVNRETALEFLIKVGGTVGFSVVGTRLAATAAKFIPFVGGLAAAPLVFGSTYGLGSVAQLYFERGQLSEEEIKSAYHQASAEAQQSFNPERARSAEVQRAVEDVSRQDSVLEEDPVARLEQLQALLERGLVEQAEYDAVKRRILDAI